MRELVLLSAPRGAPDLEGAEVGADDAAADDDG